MKAAILGASGQLGQKTLACVIERGFEAQNIVAIARTPERVQARREEGIEIRVGDYDDRSFEVESDDVARLTGQPAESFEQLLTKANERMNEWACDVRHALSRAFSAI
jgi:putative NADH-flavin reductase